MANQSPRPALSITVPANYPTVPAPGKIRILYDANKRTLYHRLSPYGSDTFFGIKTRQPFFYTYPDEAKNSSELFIVDLFNHSVKDVQRVGKYMISGPGLLWAGKQFLMQTGNAFNETRIWNPSSPIVAAGMGITLWAVRPQRNVDTSDLLTSFLGSAGSAIRSIFTTAPPSPPSGTAGRGALPTNNPAGGKGLIRAGTANAAKTTLTNKWTVQSGKGLGLGGFLSGLIKTTFGNFIPSNQKGVKYRSDEIVYGLMLGSTTGENGVFSYQGATQQISGVQQFWFGGSTKGIRKDGDGNPVEKPLNWVKIYTKPDGKPSFLAPDTSYRIDGLSGNVGYTAVPSGDALRYGDYVGTSHNDDWEGSDVLIQHSMYSKESNKYPSKFTQPQDPSVVAVKNSLQKVISDLNSVGTYKIDPNFEPDSAVLLRGFDENLRNGYDRIVAMKKHGDAETQMLRSVLNEYRNSAVLENQHSEYPSARSKKMASTRQFDGINTLSVLSGDRKIVDPKIPNWTEWKPYRDDIIAFYFYDVVNDKYIPFRATIRGLQETDSANWEELSFIGRADRLYSYSGYNRSLSFSFTVNINSVVELAPTWKRINYLMSLVKPSNYTVNPTQQMQNLHTRYMVAPMVMVTIGDLYKQQPIVIASAGCTIPDTALWETMNENNSDEWSYLVNYIKSPNVGKLYGQLPKTVEISITANVLEKERAIAGAAHFHHAPHDETYTENVYRKTPSDFAAPNEFGKFIVEYQDTRPVK